MVTILADDKQCGIGIGYCCCNKGSCYVFFLHVTNIHLVPTWCGHRQKQEASELIVVMHEHRGDTSSSDTRGDSNWWFSQLGYLLV